MAVDAVLPEADGTSRIAYDPARFGSLPAEQQASVRAIVEELKAPR